MFEDVLGFDLLAVALDPLILLMVSILFNIALAGGLAFILTNPTLRALVKASMTGDTWIPYIRSNGMAQNLVNKLEDGIYDDPNAGVILQTPNSIIALPGGLRMALVYEGLAATVPIEFVAACKKAHAAGFESISQIIEYINTQNQEAYNETQKQETDTNTTPSA